MRRPRLLLALGVALVGASAALACGSELDIDALGRGGDAGAPFEDGATGSSGGTVTDGSSGDGSSGSGDGSSGSSGSSGSAGDAGWNVPLTEDAGAWTATGWTKMASNSNRYLQAVWGSSSTAVWVGGDSGTMLFYDGTSWSSRACSITNQGHVWALSGSAADDVYALEVRGVINLGAKMYLHHYDGAAWKEVTPLPGVDEVGCLQVPARGVAYVYGAPQNTATPTTEDALRLYRVDGDADAGRVYLGATDKVVSPSGSCGLHAFAANDVWLSGRPMQRWNGQTFAPLSGAPAAGSDSLSVVTTDLAFTPVNVWNGASWQSQATGVAGSLVRVTGRTKALAFGIVLGSAPHIVRYASGGYTEETLPAGTGLLRDVWMAPNGRTFAVGDNGTILTGP